MAIGTIVETAVKAKRAYDEFKKADPEIPVPGRTRTTAPTTSISPPTNRQKANIAADMLKIPGRNVVRGAMQKRKEMLDEL